MHVIGLSLRDAGSGWQTAPETEDRWSPRGSQEIPAHGGVHEGRPVVHAREEIQGVVEHRAPLGHARTARCDPPRTSDIAVAIALADEVTRVQTRKATWRFRPGLSVRSPENPLLRARLYRAAAGAAALAPRVVPQARLFAKEEVLGSALKKQKSAPPLRRRTAPAKSSRASSRLTAGAAA